MSAPGGWVLVKIEGEEAERKVEIKRGAYLAGQLAREIGTQLEKEKEVEEGRMEGEGRRMGGVEEGMGAPHSMHSLLWGWPDRVYVFVQVKVQGSCMPPTVSAARAANRQQRQFQRPP